MIRTAIKTGTVVAALAGAALMASPANAAPLDNNHSSANGNNVNQVIVGGYGVTCGSVSLASPKSGTNCNGNGIYNAGNASETGAWLGQGFGRG
ncbi:hypothetical protein [Actinomadura rubrisoli]|uniref:DUF320 domain-containing protein n=1 Tax=Actinomadura rubrisoli TaxID=2530368 RepID=A0A4R5BA68_9ACTN|nr:hypothetical protein [Actinomadura rubrisoli]TDD82941.1 hypothetical protein E1298_21990 [Actinomadura rubrisoli]